MVGVWIWHLVAGFLGVLFSVSIFYQKLESVFSVYRKLAPEEVVRMVDAAGRDMSQEEQNAFIAFYNGLSFIGKSDRWADEALDRGVRVYLRDGEELHIVNGERFFEVERTKRNQKKVYFKLFGTSTSQSTQT
jgi:hypothetical protein